MSSELDEKQITGLKKLLSLLDPDSITKDEFVKSFKNVVNLVLKIEKTLIAKNSKTLADLETLFNGLKSNLETSTNSELSRVVAELKRLTAKSLKEQSDGLNFIRDKVKKMKEGKDGKDADENKIIAEVLKKIEIPKTELIAGQLRDLLEKLQDEERLDMSAVRGLKEAIDDLKSKAGTGMAIFGGNRPLQIQESGTVKDKVARVINFTGATVTRSTTGVVTVAVSAVGTKVSEEIPTDSGDGINFTIAHTPTSGTFRLYRGGARQKATDDYTLTLTALVLVTALISGEILICDYEY